jgi:hypothetical protein
VYWLAFSNIIFAIRNTIAGLVDAVVDIVQNGCAPSFVFLRPLGDGYHDISLRSHEGIHEISASIRGCKCIHASAENELARNVESLFAGQR